MCIHECALQYVVLEIAGEYGADVAVAYDDVARKYWEDMSAKLGSRFMLTESIRARDERLLRLALQSLKGRKLEPQAVFQQPSPLGAKGGGKGGKQGQPPAQGFKRKAESHGQEDQDSARSRGKCYCCHNRVHTYFHLARDCPDAKENRKPKQAGTAPVGVLGACSVLCAVLTWQAVGEARAPVKTEPTRDDTGTMWRLPVGNGKFVTLPAMPGL